MLSLVSCEGYKYILCCNKTFNLIEKHSIHCKECERNQVCKFSDEKNIRHYHIDSFFDSKEPALKDFFKMLSDGDNKIDNISDKKFLTDPNSKEEQKAYFLYILMLMHHKLNLNIDNEACVILLSRDLMDIVDELEDMMEEENLDTILDKYEKIFTKNTILDKIVDDNQGEIDKMYLLVFKDIVDKVHYEYFDSTKTDSKEKPNETICKMKKNIYNSFLVA
jgi:hypothetical protein